MVIAKELLAKIKKIQIKTDRMASEILAGEYKSAFRGKGLNFDKIREYQVGDDIRLLDWKVTARTNQASVRQYKEERQLSIIIIVDLSASNDFGTQTLNKKEMIVELASVLASLAIKNNDKVGMLLVTDVVESYLAPKQGKAHVFRLIRELLTFHPKSKNTDFKFILSEAIRTLPKHSVVFMVSDFLNHNNQNFNENFDYEKELKILRKTQDFIAISIRDPREFSLPNLGFIELVNPETGNKTLVNLNRQEVRQNFESSQSSHISFLKNKFKKLQIDFLELYTNKSYIHSLLTLFLTREKRH